MKKYFKVRIKRTSLHQIAMRIISMNILSEKMFILSGQESKRFWDGKSLLKVHCSFKQNFMKCIPKLF